MICIAFAAGFMLGGIVGICIMAALVMAERDRDDRN